MMIYRFCRFILVPLLLAACDNDGIVCPAVVNYSEPIVTLVASHNGRTVNNLVLSNITINGTAANLDQLQAVTGSNVSVIGTTLICNSPCKFGNEPGVYRFTVSVSGYNDVSVEQAAEYDRFDKKDCRNEYIGPTMIPVALVPDV